VTKVKDKQTEHHRISNHSPIAGTNYPLTYGPGARTGHPQLQILKQIWGSSNHN